MNTELPVVKRKRTYLRYSFLPAIILLSSVIPSLPGFVAIILTFLLSSYILFASIYYYRLGIKKATIEKRIRERKLDSGF